MNTNRTRILATIIGRSRLVGRPIIVFAALSLLLGACDGSAYQPSPTQDDAQTEPSAEAIASAQAALREETTIVDMTYQPNAPVQWQIGVFDDGSSRVGYANYVCELLALHGVSEPDTQVRIVDIVRVNAGENFRSASLGRVRCSDRRQYDR